MNMSAKLLIVNNDEELIVTSKLLLKNYFDVISTVIDPKTIIEQLSTDDYDVILLDTNIIQDISSKDKVFFLINQSGKNNPDLVVILITAPGEEDIELRAMSEGAEDFVTKPIQKEKFVATMAAALKLNRYKKEIRFLRTINKQLKDDTIQRFPDMIGRSESMNSLFKTISKVAPTEANVLILGGIGSGKKLAANTIQKQSMRSTEVFMNIDLASIPPSLIESELFGHVRGAFNNAKEDKIGRFELASGGTVFLDEISIFPLELQAKLLRILQSKKITRVGDSQSIDIDIRLIFATSCDLNKLVMEGKFRQDLYYEINTVELLLPDLKDRGEDIEILAEHFLARLCKKYNKPNLKFNFSAIKKLYDCSWPGNVRELQQIIERAVIISDGNFIYPNNILLKSTTEENVISNSSNLNLETIEKETIIKAIAKNSGNITKTAEELGLTRTSLYRKMEKYNL